MASSAIGGGAKSNHEIHKFVNPNADGRAYNSGSALGGGNGELKRVKLNYEELKKYLVRDLKPRMPSEEGQSQGRKHSKGGARKQNVSLNLLRPASGEHQNLVGQKKKEKNAKHLL